MGLLGGMRLPRNFIKGVRARRRRVGCIVVVLVVVVGEGRAWLRRG